MKDAELRELFDKLERMIAAATSQIVGGNTNAADRLTRLQELAEQGRRFEARSIELPSPRIPMIVGMAFGVAIFGAGMWIGYLIGAH
jgi:hypothetical protein